MLIWAMCSSCTCMWPIKQQSDVYSCPACGQETGAEIASAEEFPELDFPEEADKKKWN